MSTGTVDRDIEGNPRGRLPSRRVEGAMVLGALLVIGTACGSVVDGSVVPGAGQPPAQVTTVLAGDAAVPFGYEAPVQLMAAVIGAAGVHPGTSWALAPAAEGCAPFGATVTSEGLFSPPTSPETPIGGACKVIAAALADPTKTAVSTVTITAPGTLPILPDPLPGPFVSNVLAEDASVPFGQAEPIQLIATVFGTTDVNPTVTWALDPTDGCRDLNARVTTDGRFSAPDAPDIAAGGRCRVIAAAVADPSKTGVSTVTILADATALPEPTPPSEPTPPPPPPPTPSPTPTPSPSAVPAFPGAEGAGALSKGGRGGRVYRVTNLNDSGAGSLRECVEGSGPRTCVFGVAGVIHLARSMSLGSAQSHLTIAGQTAPGGGVAINLANHACSQSIFNLRNVHDVTIRYVRLWGDYTGTQDAKDCPGTRGVMFWENVHDVIVDHVSSLWHSGSAVGAWALDVGTRNVTVQHSLLGEQVLFGAGGQATIFGVAGTVSPDTYAPDRLQDFDIHHNVITTGLNRAPLVNGSGRIVNNLIANWQRATFVDSHGGVSRFDVIGNHYRPGALTSATGYSARWTEININRGTASVYVAGNKSDWNPTLAGTSSPRGRVSGTEPDATQWSMLVSYGSDYQGSFAPAAPAVGQRPAAAGHKRSPCAPLPTAGVPITVDAVASVQARLTAPGGAGMSGRLDCVGNWVDVSDAARDRVLAYVAAGTGPSWPLASAAEYNRGALPTLAAGQACADTDRDGMPDAYENANGLDRASAADGVIVGADGYTNLERYLSGYPSGSEAPPPPPACDNLLASVDAFDDASRWNPVGAAVLRNAASAPNGTVAADKLVETSTASPHRIHHFTASAPGAYTLSVYARAAERTSTMLRIGARCFSYVSLVDGSFIGGSHVSPACTSAGGGWWRCTVTCNDVAANEIAYLQVTKGTTPSYAGTPGAGIYLWGAMLEPGSSATAHCAP